MKNALLAVLITTVCHDRALAQQITLTGAYSPPANAKNSVSTTASANGAIITHRLTDGTVSSDKLASDILTTNKLTDGVATSNKLADDIINSLKITEDGKLPAGILPNDAAAGDAVECGRQRLHKPRPINSRKRTGRLLI